jgi:Family of unknown function (DUF5996)
MGTIMQTEHMGTTERWPALPLNEWEDTYHTLHLWTQIVGKIRMTLSTPINHWWHVTLYVNSRGLTTGPVPYVQGIFEIQFDFQKHTVEISTSEGTNCSRPMKPESVAVFYGGISECLGSLGIAVNINLKPQEIASPVPFDCDFAHCSYDPEYANRFWRILVSTSTVMREFRGRFIGKCSPVHFFWGSFDLACSRFSGRLAPPRRGVISGPAYSHEVCSAGFWPGGGAVNGPAFYSYIVPQPAGIEEVPKWNPEVSEFILMYDDVRLSDSPEGALLEFLESTYDAGARLAKWDRAALER